MDKQELIKFLKEKIEEINYMKKSYKISQKLLGVEIAYKEILKKLEEKNEII